MGRCESIPLISVSNHISTIDDPVMWGGLLTNKMISELIDRDRMRYVLAAKEIVFSNPIYSWFFSAGQAIPIERGKGVYQPGMDDSLGIVNKGGWLHFFPEGRVVQNFNSQQIGRLKWGVGRLIMEAKVPPLILPIFLKGFDAMKPLDRLPRPFKKVEVVVGEVENGAHFLKSTEHLKNFDLRRSKITEMIQNTLNKLAEVSR
jgi:monolysocardiolipin acyltransferase